MTILDKHKVVGIDVSKDSLAICHLAEENCSLEVSNNRAGFQQLVSSAARRACM